MSKMKDVAMTTTAIAKTEINNNAPAIQYDNVWLEVAAETGNAFGRLLKFVKGKWEIGDDEVPQGTKFVCHIDQLCRGWTKFKDGEVVDLRLVKVASGDKLPDRDALGDLDKTKWEQDDDGKPKDPWVRQWYLPLTTIDVGDFVTFVTGSNGGDVAIAGLCRAFGHRSDGSLPIIAIKTRSYKHKKYGRIETPDLALVGWHGGGPSTVTTAKPVNQVPPKTGNAAVNHDDMNDEVDEVPFWNR
jgi:hypothetical protein